MSRQLFVYQVVNERERELVNLHNITIFIRLNAVLEFWTAVLS